MTVDGVADGLNDVVVDVEFWLESAGREREQVAITHALLGKRAFGNECGAVREVQLVAAIDERRIECAEVANETGKVLGERRVCRNAGVEPAVVVGDRYTNQRARAREGMRCCSYHCVVILPFLGVFTVPQQLCHAESNLSTRQVSTVKIPRKNNSHHASKARHFTMGCFRS